MLLNYNNFTQDDLSVWPERSNVNIHSKTKQQYRYFNSFHQPVCNTFFGGYPNPCCCGCVIFLSDDFDRTIIGPSWDIRSGAWAISGNRLVETGTLNALIITSGDINSLDESQYVEVDIIRAQSGSCHKVIVNYLDDDNYHSVSLLIESGHPESGSVQLTEYIGGVSVPESYASRHCRFADSVPNDVITIKANINPFIFCGEALPLQAGTQGPVWTTKHTLIKDGLKAGLGNCSYHHEPAIYDNFLFEDEWYRHVLCPDCGCYCRGKALPDTLALTCYSDDIDGGCAGYNDLTFELKWSYLDSHWRGQGDTVGSAGCKFRPCDFIFVCANQTGEHPLGGTCEDFTLEVYEGDGTSVTCMAVFPQTFGVCSCDPLIFTYSANIALSTMFTCNCCCTGFYPDYDGQCGSFYFEVTEVPD